MGARTVNPCAHIVSLIWYFFYGRFEKKPAPSAFLNDCFPLKKSDFGFSEDELEDPDDPMDSGGGQ